MKNKILSWLNTPLYSPITGGYYSLIRILLGSYLLIHFIQLIPYGTEIFSAAGVLSGTNSPLLGILPNPLHYFDNPLTVTILLMTGVVSGLFLAIGCFDRFASLVAALILAWLYARNPLIANPSMPVVGWMLVAHCFVPSNSYGSLQARERPDKWVDWHFPREIWIAAWIMLAVAYSYSGYTKLLSPSWVDGSAISQVLENPLARDHFVRGLILGLPPIFLKLLTWGLLWLEILFIPLCFFTITRKWAWLLMLLVQCGFLIFLNFADLTFPMFLIHALTFDRRWLSKQIPDQEITLFYDGRCAFCNALVRYSLVEDYRKKISYSPLQSKHFSSKKLLATEDDTIVLLLENGKILYKSDAALFCLKTLGGFWYFSALVMALFPRFIRDWSYDVIGKIRYSLAGRAEIDSCRLLPKEYSERILF